MPAAICSARSICLFQRDVVAGLPFVGVLPHHPPLPRVHPGAHDPGGLDRLPVDDDVPHRRVVLGEVVGGTGGAGADDEREPGVFEPVQIRSRQHARVGHDHHFGRRMAFPERVQHRQQGERLALVPGELVDLQREPALVHQQPDEDLRVHPAFLTHPDAGACPPVRLRSRGWCSRRARP